MIKPCRGCNIRPAVAADGLCRECHDKAIIEMVRQQLSDAVDAGNRCPQCLSPMRGGIFLCKWCEEGARESLRKEAWEIETSKFGPHHPWTINERGEFVLVKDLEAAR